MKEELFTRLKDKIRKLNIFNIVYSDISGITKTAQSLEHNSDILVFGTGGSNLGAKALIDFKSGFDGTVSRVHFLENVDSRSFLNTVNRCNPETTGIIVISKSGNTTETLMLFFTLMTMWPDYDYSNRCIVITENATQNYLRKIAIFHGMQIIDHPDDIGGRFSVFSVVGLLPALIHGVNVDLFLSGAKKALQQAESGDENLKKNIIDSCEAIKNGAFHHVLFTYSDFLTGLGKWFVQLVAESLGKSENFGITSISATGTIDQHSMLQLFLGGPNDKYYTFITQKKNVETDRITAKENILDGHNIQELMISHQKATINVLKKKALVREFEFEELNEEALGYMMMLCIIETVAIADEFNINPFDQPAVEESKKLAIQYLDLMK